MERDRLAAFSDGVIAVIITIMVLELKVPHSPDLQALCEQAPVFFSYVLSFVYVAIYWNNHHHLFQLVPRVNGAVLWANMHLLFWLSLVPFATGWMGQNHLVALPTAIYGVALLMPAVAWAVLLAVLIRLQGTDSALARAMGRDRKGKLSVVLYLAGIAGSFVHPWLGVLAYVAVALLWLVPDRRVECTIEHG